jgi:hypothetical protein
MKYILSIVLFVTMNVAHGMGKLSLQNNFYNNGKDYRPQMGLVIYQPLIWKMAFNSFTGFGIQPLEEQKDVKWFVTKNQIDFKYNKWTFSPGYQYQETLQDDVVKQFAFVKVDYQLW